MDLLGNLRRSCLVTPKISVCHIILEILFILFVLTLVFNPGKPANAQNLPIIKDDRLEVTQIVNGLKLPTAMDFLADNDILVLEKDNGTIRRIVNGSILKEPVLDLNVANKWDRGILGLSILKGDEENQKNTYVLVYLTESTKDGIDECPTWKFCSNYGGVLGNRLYRYNWNGHSLVEPKLLLDLPAEPGPAHNGGVLLIGPDKNIYLITGDLRSPKSVAQNIHNGAAADGSSGILRITLDGKAVGHGILGKSGILNKYYAYGIRNSFGMDFDPVSGKLWDTENGYLFGDEINLVRPGFNSGWAKIQGMWEITDLDEYGIDALKHGQMILEPKNLNEFNGKGKYSSPELFWNKSVGLTSLKFLNTTKYGTEYENDMLVGDFYGRIYHFELNKQRSGIEQGHLAEDKMMVLNGTRNIFGDKFEGVTDISVGPDGYVYILSLWHGAIYKILPKLSSR
jgi:aldose sugar dehydrogenase